MRPSKMSESSRKEGEGSEQDFLHSQKYLAYGDDDESFDPIQTGTLVKTSGTDQHDEVVNKAEGGGDHQLLEMEESPQAYDRQLWELGIGPNSQKPLRKPPSSTASHSFPEWDSSHLNLSGSRGNSLFDTIDSYEGNNYWDADTDEMLECLGSEPKQLQLKFSQDSFGSMDKYLGDTDIGPLGNENICFQQFPGHFGFKITPLESKRSVFTEEHNKFFCKLGTYYEFNIELDFETMRNPEKYAIRAALIYTDPQHHNIPVKKCITCAEIQKKKHVDEEAKGLLYHIVRGNLDDKHLAYQTSDKTGFCYTIIGLRAPELGSKTLLPKLEFTCRSSCRSDGDLGINRRATALVFSLLDHRKRICGRSVVNVRICSAPSRDFKTEFGEDPRPVQPRKKRKKAIAVPLAIVRTEVQLDPYNDGFVPIASTSRTTNEVQIQAAKPFDLDKPVDGLYQKSSQQGSQDSTIEYEDEEGGPRRSIRLGSLSMQCKRVLQWINSNDPIQRAAAMQVFESLKCTERVCSTSTCIIKEAQDRRNAGQGDYN